VWTHDGREKVADEVPGGGDKPAGRVEINQETTRKRRGER